MKPERTHSAISALQAVVRMMEDRSKSGLPTPSTHHLICYRSAADWAPFDLQPAQAKKENASPNLDDRGEYLSSDKPSMYNQHGLHGMRCHVVGGAPQVELLHAQQHLSRLSCQI